MLQDFRDVMIIISSFLVIAASIILIVVTIVISRKLSRILNAAQDVSSDIRSVSSFVSGKVMGPITRSTILATGIRKAISTLSKRSHRKDNSDG